ncbi:conserved hypothetical protein [delta proteobacterium NaphS2]|nr:conserved hypothetical protein [delta proteobacterium NaphS2]
MEAQACSIIKNGTMRKNRAFNVARCIGFSQKGPLNNDLDSWRFYH